MKLFYYGVLAVGLGVLALGGQAQAQTAPATSPSTTYGQLSDLVSQIAILKAQMQVVQLQQQIEAAKHGAINAPGVTTVPALPNARSVSNMAGAGIRNPEIVSISGRAGRLNAVLLMPGGGEVNVVAGTRLGDGVFVRSISPQAVWLSQYGKLMALPFVGGSLFSSGG